MTFKIPTPLQTLDVTMDDGAVVRVRQHSRGTLRLLLSHGNGFAIDAYFPFWGPLLEQFEIVVFDIRNHGQNPLHRLESHDQAHLVQDFETLYRQIPDAFGTRPTIGVFHSVSAITALLQNLKHGKRWDALLLVDPSLTPPAGHPLYQRACGFEFKLRDWALGRQHQFENPAELAAILKSMPRMNRWCDGSHDLLAASTLRETGNQWELACPGAYEARIYAGNADLDIWHRLPSLTGPVCSLGADPVLRGSWPPAFLNRAVHAELGLAYRCVAETTHLMQIERPAAVAAELVDFIARSDITPVRALRDHN